MIHRSTISNLPRGMGGVLGIFARNSFLTQYSQWKVIGVRIADLTVFSSIPDSTDTVMDVVLRLSKMNFELNETAVAAIHGVEKFDNGETIYKIPFYMTGTTLTTQDFSPALVVDENQEILNTLYAPADGLCITLYIRKICGVSGEEINKSYLLEVDQAQDTVPVAVSGMPVSKVYFNVEDRGVSEDLEFVFDGPESEYQAFSQMITQVAPQQLANLVK